MCLRYIDFIFYFYIMDCYQYVLRGNFYEKNGVVAVGYVMVVFFYFFLSNLVIQF